LYGEQGKRDKFRDIKDIVNSAPGNYTIITEDWRQENFVLAVSVIYYLHDKEAQPDFLFPWLLPLLKHPRGNLRYAAAKMIMNELGPLTVHIRFPGKKSYTKDLAPEKADAILRSLFISLNNLLGIMHERKYNRYKYVDSLPASPYKSVQMVMAEMEDLCGREYMMLWQGNIKHA